MTQESPFTVRKVKVQRLSQFMLYNNKLYIYKVYYEKYVWCNNNTLILVLLSQFNNSVFAKPMCCHSATKINLKQFGPIQEKLRVVTSLNLPALNAKDGYGPFNKLDKDDAKIKEFCNQLSPSEIPAAANLLNKNPKR